MEKNLLAHPGLTLSLALVIGVVAQTLARHLKIPGIIILLLSGMLVGPDFLALIDPGTLDGAFEILISFAVGIILFEGGLNLNLKRLKRQARSIRNLVSIGAIVTQVGAAIAAKLIMDWPWTSSFLFGSLVIVTGPTVINPLMKRLRIKSNVATVLEAEGIFIDAIGALLALITLEFVMAPSGKALALGVWQFFSKMGFGLIWGALWGYLIGITLRWRPMIPSGLENIYTLSLVLLLFQSSNSILPESGIMATITAGFIVGNLKTRALEELKEFKEQLTVLFIGMLFVLLASDVKLAQVYSLGVPGIMTVVVLMVLIRPLNVFISTYKSELKFKEKLFLCWMAPRGIISAAMATLFAKTLLENNFQYGNDLQAMVFLVIITTVALQGLTGGLLAKILGLQRPSKNGLVVYEASPLGLTIGRILREVGQETVFIDANIDRVQKAQSENFKVVYGNGYDENLLLRAEVDGRLAVLALSPYDEVNFLFLSNVKKLTKDPTWMPLNRDYFRVDLDMVLKSGSHVLFGDKINISLWNQRIDKGQVELGDLVFQKEKILLQEVFFTPTPEKQANCLPLMVLRKGKYLLVREKMVLEKGDRIKVLFHKEQMEDLLASCQELGLVKLAFPQDKTPTKEKEAPESATFSG